MPACKPQGQPWHGAGAGADHTGCVQTVTVTVVLFTSRQSGG
jgi:hypothetical protein